MDLIDRSKINMRQADEDIVFDLLHEEPVDAVLIDWIEQKIKELGNTEIEECRAFKYLIELWREDERKRTY